MVVDYIDAVFLPIILLYLLWVLREKKEAPQKPCGGVPFDCGPRDRVDWVVQLCELREPVTRTEQLYLHASSVFTEFSYPLYLGAYLNLFSPYRGLFVYSIFLVLGVFGFYDMVRDSTLQEGGLLLLACFLGIFIPYSMWYDPTGGEGFGPRFLVAAIPFLLLPAGISHSEGGQEAATGRLRALCGGSLR